MVKLCIIVFPDGSTEVYSTVVTPIGYDSPGLWLDVNSCDSELSVAVGSTQLTTAVADPSPVFCIMSAGIPNITGFTISVEI